MDSGAWRNLRRGGLIVIFAGVMQSVAPGWDAGGHEVIATMAWDRMNAKARAAATELARGIETPGQPYNPITAACWMDDLRGNEALPHHGEFLSWHFIDMGIDPGSPEQPMEPNIDTPSRGNVVQGLKRALVVLEGGSDFNVTSKPMAFAMVMHLVGDIHQPLHCATHYFVSGGQLRNDAGGNKEGVDNGPAGEERFNLHAFWDTAWRASFDEGSGRVVLDDRFREFGGHDPAAVRELATELEKTELAKEVDVGTNLEAWARESNGIARDFVYPGITPTRSRKYCTLSEDYVVKAQGIARQRLVLAAWRLAALLNATLGADVPVKVPASYPAGLGG